MPSALVNAITERGLHPQVYADLVERLFGNGLSIASMGFIFAVFGGYVAYRSGDVLTMVLVGCAVCASAAHVSLCVAHRRAEPQRRRDAVERWDFAYAALGCLSAFLVGLTCARVYAGKDMAGCMVMTAMLFGYASGVMARNAVRFRFGVPRVWFLVIAPVIALEGQDELPCMALGLSIVLFTAAGLESMLTLYGHARAEIELRLRQSDKAREDPLTGLANRRGLDHFVEALEARYDPRWVAVFCLDLDRFKEVNDQHGHAAGDALLQSVSERLRDLCGPADLVARLGGDEFVVVRPAVLDRREAEAFASMLVEALRFPHRIGDIDVRASVSVGVALRSGHPADVRSLILDADLALYASKSGGRGCFVVYDQASMAAGRTSLSEAPTPTILVPTWLADAGHALTRSRSGS